MANYTYTDFANDAIAIAEDINNINDIDLTAFADKAAKLLVREGNKAAYNATTGKSGKSKAKGASPETLERVARFVEILTEAKKPMTGAEIAEIMEVAPVVINTLFKYSEGVTKGSEVRDTVNKKGLHEEKALVVYSV